MQKILGVVLALMLAACVAMPQNPEDFRKAVSGGATLTKTESYEVNRSVQAVGATFKQRAPQCLGVQVRTVSQTSTSYQNILTTYTPTVIATGQRAELHVQQLHKGGGVIYPQKPPEGGVYLFVVDATPVSPNRARIQLYGPSLKAYDVVYRAIRGWTTGENLGCPDMTKIG
jgi:hypothetical protein